MTAMCPVLSIITRLKSRGGQFSTCSTSALVLCEVEGDLCTAGAAGSTGPVAVAVGDVGIGTAGAGTGLFGDCGAVEAQNQALELRPFATSKTLRCSQRGESSAAAAMEGGRPCINLVSPVCNKYPSLNVFLRRKASKACTCEACVRVIRLDAGIPVTTRSDVEDRRCGPAGTALPGQRKPTRNLGFWSGTKMRSYVQAGSSWARLTLLGFPSGHLRHVHVHARANMCAGRMLSKGGLRFSF